jgi:hypothetical protein
VRDLFVIVADLDAENGFKALLQRHHHSLGIGPIDFDPSQDILRFNGRDSGCCGEAVELVRAALRTHKHVLLVFDRDGSGREGQTRTEIEADIEKRFDNNGWSRTARVIVVDPELEAWVWSDSAHVAGELGWGNMHELHEFLLENDWLSDAHADGVPAKPRHPKEAMEAALREKRVAISSKRFGELGQKVGRLSHCVDAAFQKLIATLKEWFPSNAQECNDKDE